MLNTGGGTTRVEFVDRFILQYHIVWGLTPTKFLQSNDKINGLFPPIMYYINNTIIMCDGQGMLELKHLTVFEVFVSFYVFKRALHRRYHPS